MAKKKAKKKKRATGQNLFKVASKNKAFAAAKRAEAKAAAKKKRAWKKAIASAKRIIRRKK